MTMEEKQKRLQKQFEKNLKYISQMEISVETIEKQFVNDNKHHCMPVGKAHFPTGRIIVADPLAYLPSNEYSPELEIKIPKSLDMFVLLLLKKVQLQQMKMK